MNENRSRTWHSTASSDRLNSAYTPGDLDDRHFVPLLAAGQAFETHLGPLLSALNQGRLQLHPEHLEWHRSIDRRQRIAIGIQARGTVLKIEKSKLDTSKN